MGLSQVYEMIIKKKKSHSAYMPSLIDGQGAMRACGKSSERRACPSLRLLFPLLLSSCLGSVGSSSDCVNLASVPSHRLSTAFLMTPLSLPCRSRQLVRSTLWMCPSDCNNDAGDDVPGDFQLRPSGQRASIPPPMPELSSRPDQLRFSVRRSGDPPLSEQQVASDKAVVNIAQRKEFSKRYKDFKMPSDNFRGEYGSDTIGRLGESGPRSDWHPDSDGAFRQQRGAFGRRNGDRSNAAIRLGSLGRPADVARDLMNLVDGQAGQNKYYDQSRGTGSDTRTPRGRSPSRASDRSPRGGRWASENDDDPAWLMSDDDTAAGRAGSWQNANEELLRSKVSLVPKNLSSFASIQDLLPIFEEAVANGTRFVEVVEGADAVAAMNHLKRLSRQVRNDRAVSDRLERVLIELARVAELGMPGMSGKNVALALNSVSHRQGFDDLYAAGIARLRTICASKYAANLQTQSLAMMVNALAKRRMLDSSLLGDISLAAQRLDPLTYSPQSVAIILNSYSKLPRPDSSLFIYMSTVATQLEARAWDAQSCALLLNSFARSGERDPQLFRHFERIIVHLDTRSFTAQNIANIVNAYAKCGYNSTGVFEHMSAATRAIPPSYCDAQAVANILNGFSRMRVWDAELFAHLTRATLLTPASAFSAQSIANTLNAHARMGNRNVELLTYISRIIQEACAQQGFGGGPAAARSASGAGDRGAGAGAGAGGEGAAWGGKDARNTLEAAAAAAAARQRDQTLSFDPQAVANIVNAYARLEMRDETLFALMEHVIVDIASSRWDAQAVALVLNAYAKVELHPPGVFEVLSNLAVTLPRHSWNAQAVANVANALAKADVAHTSSKYAVLLDKLGDICGAMSPADFTGQAVSSIMNAYAKLDHSCPKLFRHMARTILLMPLATFQPQAIANIVNAFMRFKDLDTDARMMEVFERMSEAAQRNAPRAFSGQAISVILNAYVRKGLIDRELFAYISRTIQSLPAEVFDAQNIALITNAFAKAEMFDEELLRYMARVAMLVKLRPEDSQNVAVIINAYAKADMLENEPATAALMDKLALDIPRLSPTSTNAQAIGNIVNGYARYLYGLETRARDARGMAAADRHVFRYMASLALQLKPRDFDVQSLTLLTHAFARITADNPSDAAAPGRGGGGGRGGSSAAGGGGGAEEEAEEARATDDAQKDLTRLNSLLFVHLGNVCLNIPSSEFDGAALASQLTSFVKVNVTSDSVIEHLANCIHARSPSSANSTHPQAEVRAQVQTEVHAEVDGGGGAVEAGSAGAIGFSLQSLVMMLSAFARAERPVPAKVLASLTRAIVRTPASQWTGQSCSNLLNSLARLHELQLAPRHLVLEVFEYVSQVVRASEIYMYEGVYDAQNVAIMCNGMARIDYGDQALLLHLSLIIQQMHPDQFDVQAVSNIVNAYVKLDVEPEVRRYLLEFMSVVIQCFDADEEFSAQSISNIVNAYAKADMVEEALPLFEHMALAAQLMQPAEYNAQAVANVFNAYAKVSRQLQQLDAQVDIASLFAHMSAAAQTIDVSRLDMQNIANIINALAKTYTYDAALLSHLTAALAANARRHDLSQDTQAMANIMHGLATLNYRVGLEPLMAELVPHITRMSLDPQNCQAQGIANVCWSVAVLQLDDSSLLDWCRRALSLRLVSMNWSCLRQVQQFLLTLEMDALLPAKVSIAEALPRALRCDTATLLLRASVASPTSAARLAPPAASGGELLEWRELVDLAGRRANSSDSLEWRELVELAAHCLVRSACVYASIAQGLPPRDLERYENQAFAEPHAAAEGTEEGEARWVGAQSPQSPQYSQIPEAAAPPEAESRVPNAHRGGGSGGEEEGEGEEARWGGGMSAMKAFRKVLRAEASASRLQAEICLHVVDLGLEFEEEFVDDKTGYSIDMFVPAYQCAVEVDGPFHYIANGFSELGSTVMKHRHLRQCGIRLVVIPFFEWNAVAQGGGVSREKKLAYLRAKFETVLPKSSGGSGSESASDSRASHAWPAGAPGGFDLAALESVGERRLGAQLAGGEVEESEARNWREGRANAAAARVKAQERLRLRQSALNSTKSKPTAPAAPESSSASSPALVGRREYRESGRERQQIKRRTQAATAAAAAEKAEEEELGAVAVPVLLTPVGESTDSGRRGTLQAAEEDAEEWFQPSSLSVDYVASGEEAGGSARLDGGAGVERQEWTGTGGDALLSLDYSNPIIF